MAKSVPQEVADRFERAYEELVALEPLLPMEAHMSLGYALEELDAVRDVLAKAGRLRE